MTIKKDISIKDYLTQKGVKFADRGAEIITDCLFSNCDVDSRGGEAHLYFNTETGQYDCKKCGAKGNVITLAKHLGDTFTRARQTPNQTFDEKLVEECHKALPGKMYEYLRGRGISDEVINAHKLGYGKFYGKWWITIPIKDVYGNYIFFKLRQDPAYGSDKITYPKGVEAQLYDWQTVEHGGEALVICEGELDRLLLASRGVTAVTSTHGAGTFKQEWADSIAAKYKKAYIVFDNDEPGRKGAERAAKMIEHGGHETYIVTLPNEVGNSGDITDYFVKLNGATDDLFGKYAKPYPERIDVSKFSPLTPEQLVGILASTIKHDDVNKQITFLCELSAFTENAQFNISFNAPSATGKSYCPTEIARYFPPDDVIEIAYCSPTAFFHDVGEYDKENNRYTADLSHKILIFLDQPHNELLARLRPLLSHDKKEILLKITDKSQKFGMKTKNILLRGYPSVIFCTAGLRIDEQEATRFLLLSPEVSQEKIQGGIDMAIRKESDSATFASWLNDIPERALLIERIRAIKLAGITEINIANPDRIRERFLRDNRVLKPRHQRDIKRLLSLVKAFALLNPWWRECNGSTIVANDGDIEAAIALWDKIAVSQELNIPPYIYNLYQEVILPAWRDKNAAMEATLDGEIELKGISRQEVLAKHSEVYGRMLDGTQLRQQILPMLETAGLIAQEQDAEDKRNKLIYPTDSAAIAAIKDAAKPTALPEVA